MFSDEVDILSYGSSGSASDADEGSSIYSERTVGTDAWMISTLNLQ